MGQGPAERESSLASHEAAARKFLESNAIERAIEVLESYADPSGVRDALLGAAYFRQEKYGIAAECLQRAQAMGQRSSELQALAARAKANATADVRRAVPEPVLFTR